MKKKNSREKVEKLVCNWMKQMVVNNKQHNNSKNKILTSKCCMYLMRVKLDIDRSCSCLVTCN